MTRTDDPGQPASGAPDALELAARGHLAAGDPARALAAASAGWQARPGADAVRRQGSSGLLAAAAWRTAGDLQSAATALAALQSAPLPAALRRGCELEACEQALAAGDAVRALAGLRDFIARHAADLPPTTQALLHQRHAAAALAAGQAGLAADALLDAARLLDGAGPGSPDAEACRIAAASALATLDAAAAEALWQQTTHGVPRDGAEAFRRRRVGACVALRDNAPDRALQRLDAARQGALDVGDALACAEVALLDADVARQLGLPDVAYARLATAWGTLSERIGRELTAQTLRPALQALRDHIGASAFAAARTAYESRRRATLGSAP